MPKKRVLKKKVVTKKKKRSVLDSIEPLGTGLESGIKMALYGRTGTGKTTLWATFPKPILAIICSGIIRSGEVRSILTPQNKKDIKQHRYTTKDRLISLLEDLKVNNPFATIVLDHATSLQDRILQEILGLEELPAQGSWGMASREQWGQCSLQTKEVLRSLLNLTGNTIVVAQEREFNTEAENDIIMPYVGAALTPSVTGWLNQTCDYICQTYHAAKTKEKIVKIGKKNIKQNIKLEGVEFRLRTAPHEVFQTRFRMPVSQSSKIPDFIVDPTYSKIEEWIC